MHIDKTKQRSNTPQHLENAVIARIAKFRKKKKNKMQVLALEEEFGESLEDEVCNAKRHFYFAFHFTVFCLLLPLKTFCARINK